MTTTADPITPPDALESARAIRQIWEQLLRNNAAAAAYRKPPTLTPGAPNYNLPLLSHANVRALHPHIVSKPRSRAPFETALLERVHLRMPAVPGVAA